MTHQDDTQPKAPAGLQEAIAASGHQEDTQPVKTISLESDPPTNFFNLLMMGGVVMLAACLCLSIVLLAGAAGVRDELKAVNTQAAATQLADVATQYALGETDIQEERYEMAQIRFSYIETEMPNYQDAAVRLQEVQTILAYTPTPSPETPVPTVEAPTPTLDSGVAASEGVTPTLSAHDPAELYGLAETAMNTGNFEDAIRWYDALALVDPNYRRDEVQQNRLQALISQGRIYLRGQNPDGEDRLAQGVLLINRASELGTVPVDLVYEADFVARYIAGRAYMEGGAFEQARQVLTKLCEENCDWAYQGVSVRSLLARVGG